MNLVDYAAVLLIGLATVFNGWAVIRLSRRVASLEARETTGCAHHDLKNVGTFGHPEYQCQSCGVLVEQ